jgi:GT2 family glycosyltransferase
VINAPDLYIVITDFDGWEQTRVCITRLENSSYRNINIIVVDHGLTNETAIGLANFPQCLRIPASSELWWTAATNIGIRAARERGAEFIMLLNNDCFVDDSTIEHLMQYMRVDNKRIIAPVQRHVTSGAVIAAKVGTCFLLGFPTFVLPSIFRSKLPSGDLVPTSLIIGGRGVVIPWNVFEKLGLFDESSLPHYGADHDFYLRCARYDVPLWIATNASVLVDETKTSLSRHLGRLTGHEFMMSFQDTRSHRNLSVLTTLFRRYYPIKRLYMIGVAFNVARYTLCYLVLRCLYRLKSVLPMRE